MCQLKQLLNCTGEAVHGQQNILPLAAVAEAWALATATLMLFVRLVELAAAIACALSASPHPEHSARILTSW